MPVDRIPPAGAEPARPAAPSKMPGADFAAALPPGGEGLPPAGKGVPAAAARDLEQVVRHLGQYVQSLKRDLQFSVDAASGRTVIRVVDAETGAVIRQIPSEEILALARHLEVPGLFIRDKA
jgi:flagellar protein FlaG